MWYCFDSAIQAKHNFKKIFNKQVFNFCNSRNKNLERKPQAIFKACASDIFKADMAVTFHMIM